ncbi:GNAT family N-acetyltransferase [Bosea sp. (in: a-proteobacteria)]|uniref:GNAT family N-acetyltransferase n=1 Tax=Bosea sp. (in: a-proteobacteria) TaxID=1871050 RepID=UPI002734F0F9|nr:GNAT family N-acetyltransferase [Bosea sp. (in: a-proteobacteria)]MDP3407147.1 GNAT family N-acetyltransferase [Bosea sp. (in: a-proteobacteria)]
MTALTIRPLTTDDRAAWDPLWQGYLTFYKASIASDISDATFARLTGGAEPMGGFVAEREGALIGLVHWVIHRTTWNTKDICYLQDLFTAPEARGTGAGRALIEAGRQMAQAKGCFRVYWQTHESNAQAQALYDKVADKSGFIVYRQPLG